MIDTETFVPLAYFKKEAYTGSHLGMRYLVKKEEDKLAAYVYPEPYCFEATSDVEKNRQEFELTPAGREEAILWLNQQYQIFDASRIASPNR